MSKQTKPQVPQPLERKLQELPTQVGTMPRAGFRVSIPRAGRWREPLNSDAKDYWGGGIGNAGGVPSEAKPSHGRPNSIVVTLPPLSAVYLKHEG